MSLLSYNELCELVERGVITNVRPDQVNSSSIDLTLGNILLIEDCYVDGYSDMQPPAKNVSLKQRTPLLTKQVDLSHGAWVLRPGAFTLAQSQQMFNLPSNISAEYKLKSSMARIGLEHLNAGWCDAGWHGSVLTLELKNMTQYHGIELEEGVGIGQVVFFRHEAVPEHKSYAARGRYNNDTTVSGIKV